MIHIRDDLLQRTALVRPTGYLDDIAAHASYRGGFWTMSEADYEWLKRKYAPVLSVDVPRPVKCC